MIGTAGDDLIIGTSGDDVIVGLDGRDRIEGLAGDDLICGGGNSYLVTEGRIATFTYEQLYGGDGNDRIDGGEGFEDIYGGAGDDVLRSLIGPVTPGDVTSEADYPKHEYISGEDGADQLYGGMGRQELIGGAGDDILWAGAGSDLLGYDGGFDQLYGGEGADMQYASFSAQGSFPPSWRIVFYGGPGRDSAASNPGPPGSYFMGQWPGHFRGITREPLRLHQRPEGQRQVRGRPGSDTLLGGRGDDSLDGQQGQGPD